MKFLNIITALCATMTVALPLRDLTSGSKGIEKRHPEPGLVVARSTIMTAKNTFVKTYTDARKNEGATRIAAARKAGRKAGGVVLTKYRERQRKLNLKKGLTHKDKAAQHQPDSKKNLKETKLANKYMAKAELINKKLIKSQENAKPAADNAAKKERQYFSPSAGQSQHGTTGQSGGYAPANGYPPPGAPVTNM